MGPKMRKSKRPDELPSRTVRVKTGYGNLYVTVTEVEDGSPFEVFATVGKSGASIMAKAEVTGRLASLALRHGIDVKEVIDQLRGISGEKPTPVGGEVIRSIPDAVGLVLARLYTAPRFDEEAAKAGPNPPGSEEGDRNEDR